MLADFLTLPCTISRRVDSIAEDDFGNKLTSNLETETLCELQQRARAESTDAGTVAVTEWALFLGPNDDIAVGDAVTIGGSSYEVRGTPWLARNGVTGRVEHIEATLVETVGRAPGGGS